MEAVPFELDIIPATVGELLEEVVLRLADNYNANLGANDILDVVSVIQQYMIWRFPVK